MLFTWSFERSLSPYVDYVTVANMPEIQSSRYSRQL